MRSGKDYRTLDNILQMKEHKEAGTNQKGHEQPGLRRLQRVLSHMCEAPSHVMARMHASVEQIKMSSKSCTCKISEVKMWCKLNHANGK